MPERFYLNMQDSPVIILQMDIKTRLPRLMQEYSVYPTESLKSSVLKISKRLGGDNTREALRSIESGDIGKAIEITLGYYDKAYMFGLKKKTGNNIICINADSDDIETNTVKVIAAAGKINWPSIQS
jgi:tRNA 2-selenouridine synthase